MHSNIPGLHRRIKQLEGQPLQGGTLMSFTTIRHPPAGFGHEPYSVGLIQFDDGRRVCAQLTGDGKAPMIGVRVVPHMRYIRTLPNGLRVNDLKYEIVEQAPAKIDVQHYVLALTGPSGVGKTTIARSLLKLFHVQTEQLPVYTTRPKKKGDTEPYVHVSEDTFESMVQSGEIIAHTQMPSKSELRRYGYRRVDIENLWKENKLPVVVTDINLLKGLAENLGRRAVLSCGLLPPGNSRRSRLSALLHRLRSRGRDTDEQIKERLEIAKSDLTAFDTYAHLFDHMLVNDNLELCIETIQQLVRKP